MIKVFSTILLSVFIASVVFMLVCFFNRNGFIAFYPWPLRPFRGVTAPHAIIDHRRTDFPRYCF